MARQLSKLTTISVRQARRRGLYGDGGGLFLQVSAGGSQSWVFRWKQGGKFHVMGLGPVHTVNLAEARDKALACRKLRLEGIDPIAERRARRAEAQLDAAKAMTFQQCAEAYIDSYRIGWRQRTLDAWEGTLKRHVYPAIGKLPVQAIDVALVMKAVEPVWRDTPETADRVRGRIESVLDWAAARGYRRGDNPARWRGHLENLLPKSSQVRRVKHYAALPYAELGAFMAVLRAQEGITARALEFAILTCGRTDEVIRAPWEEIKADRLWVIPAPGRPLSNMAMMMALRRMGRGDLTVHGFRSTFRDWAAECTAFPAEVAEMALAHAVGNKVEAAYRRGDLFQKRRQLAEAWAAFCEAPPITGEVVALRASAAE
jgi:integrase